MVNTGEWWKSDVQDVYYEFLSNGGAPNDSDAITINGQPGDLYPCSESGRHQNLILKSSKQAEEELDATVKSCCHVI